MTTQPHDIIDTEATGLPVVTQTTGPNILAIIDRAAASGAPQAAETVERLLAVYERMQAISAKQQFVDAMTAFRNTCPPVVRRTQGDKRFTEVTANGTSRTRRFASLEDIERTIREPLGKCGLSFRWANTSVAGGLLTVHCVVSHAGGHSESSPVTIPTASNAGCSEAQKFGAAMTYAQRLSLVQALGLTTCGEEDTDGADPNDATPITADEVAWLRAELKAVGSTEHRFAARFDVKTIEEIPAAVFYLAKNDLAQKREALAQKAAQEKRS